MSNQPITILLIDDDDIDVRVVQRAFKAQHISNPMIVARNGEEGLEKLRGTADCPPLEQPLLVLLDLKMPRMNGLEFLAELREDPKLSQTIVFVLTTSNDEQDRAAAYDKHIAGYLLKSEAGKDLMNHIPMLENFLLTVQFPSKDVRSEQQPVLETVGS